MGGRGLVQYPLKLIMLCPISAFITNQNFYISNNYLCKIPVKATTKTSIVSTMDIYKTKPSAVNVPLLQARHLLVAPSLSSTGHSRADGHKVHQHRVAGSWEDGRSRKNKESVFPSRQQLHWKNLSVVTILKFWSLLRACKSYGRRLARYITLDGVV